VLREEPLIKTRHVLLIALAGLLVLVACALRFSFSGKGAPSPNPITAPSISPAVPKPPSSTLTFVTYNVLEHTEQLDKRGPPLLKIIGDADADVIALQEISPEFLRQLIACEWSAKYKGLTESGEPVAHEELCILSKFPVVDIEYLSLPGRLHRGALIAKIAAPGRTLAVATVHLESFLEDGPMRAEQLDLIFPKLKNSDDAVLLGDFNFGDGEEPDSSHLAKNFVDLWPALYPTQPGYTWNIEVSNMALRSSFPTEKSRRLDRILWRSGLYQPESATILGDQPVEKGKPELFPSDHFGLKGIVR
jgi:tyrosyl-DNA phosphodiesterase 2